MSQAALSGGQSLGEGGLLLGGGGAGFQPPLYETLIAIYAHVEMRLPQYAMHEQCKFVHACADSIELLTSRLHFSIPTTCTYVRPLLTV